MSIQSSLSLDLARYPLTTRLYLLFGPGRPGLLPASGGVFDPLPFIDGKWLLESDLPDEARVVGGEDLSNHELSVDELLFPLVVCCERCSSLPSLLEEELWSEEGLLFAELAVLKEAFDRRRRLRSLRKEGIAGDYVSLPAEVCVVGGREVHARRYCRRRANVAGVKGGSRSRKAGAS